MLRHKALASRAAEQVRPCCPGCPQCPLALPRILSPPYNLSMKFGARTVIMAFLSHKHLHWLQDHPRLVFPSCKCPNASHYDTHSLAVLSRRGCGETTVSKTINHKNRARSCLEALLPLQEAVHLQEEERKIYINLSNQEKLAEQEEARADKVWASQAS